MYPPWGPNDPNFCVGPFMLIFQLEHFTLILGITQPLKSHISGFLSPRNDPRLLGSLAWYKYGWSTSRQFH